MTDTGYWAAATNYVTGAGSGQKSADASDDRQRPGDSQVSIAASTSGPKPELAGNEATATPQPGPKKQESRPAAVAPSGAPVIPGSVDPSSTVPQSSIVIPDQFPLDAMNPGDPLAWRPLAAMVITGSEPASGLLEPHPRSDHPGESSGQSAGTGASTEIASGRVGCMKVNCRACSAILNWPSRAFNRLLAPYLRIADDRQAPARELNAELVASPGPGPQLELGAGAHVVSSDPERDPRLLARRASPRYDAGAVPLAVLFEQSIHSPAGSAGRPSTIAQ